MTTLNASRKTREEIIEKAAALWASFDQNARRGVQFGMFPAEPMDAAYREGYPSHPLVCALMDVAKQNGGMRA